MWCCGAATGKASGGDNQRPLCGGAREIGEAATSTPDIADQLWQSYIYGEDRVILLVL